MGLGRGLCDRGGGGGECDGCGCISIEWTESGESGESAGRAKGVDSV